MPYANLTNPQTLNLYAMVSDNPETFADFDGHAPPEESQANEGSDTNTGCNYTSNKCDDNTSNHDQGVWDSIKAGVGKALSNMVQDAVASIPSASELGGYSDIAGHQAPPEQASNATEAVAMAATKAAVIAGPALLGGVGEGAAAETPGKAALLQMNKAAGDAFRDAVAGSLKAAGRDVQTEVTKQTPFGKRVVDIEVSHNGKTLGGVETKTGNSPYKPSQRAKDTYLKQQGYPVNLVRKAE